MGNSRITRNPAPVIPGLSDSVRVGAGDLLFLSGVVAFEEDGSLPSDFARAVELTYRELERALRAGGASFSTLVRVNVYVAGLDQDKLMLWREIRDRFQDPDNLPASTIVGVTWLFRDAAIEIDAIAAV